MRTAFRAASPALLATVSAVALLSAAPAFAQEAPDEAATVDEIVVTGTRVPNRSRLDTLAPVDVVSAQSLQNRGTTEFATALAQSVPSLTFPRPSANDGSDSIRRRRSTKSSIAGSIRSARWRCGFASQATPRCA